MFSMLRSVRRELFFNEINDADDFCENNRWLRRWDKEKRKSEDMAKRRMILKIKKGRMLKWQLLLKLYKKVNYEHRVGATEPFPLKFLLNLPNKKLYWTIKSTPPPKKKKIDREILKFVKHLKWMEWIICKQQKKNY